MARINVEYIEQQLKEAGKQLFYPSDSIDDLLSLLDQVEKLLFVVDQSPKLSMLDALKPSMKALVQDSLLKHSDVDVKVAVASCLSEVMRITAPDAPYDDDQMRDVFQLIVSSFEHLADHSNRSYNKRALILEIVSKVRLYVIMLDIECDGLIVQMFEYFLRSVRDYHLDSIYSIMENIMVLVLEESGVISVGLLKPLLASVKKDSEGVLPVARMLGEGVILKSADKLKPYLMPAIISLGDTLDDYSEVVASVCEETIATIEQNDEDASGLQPADEIKLTMASDHMDQVVKVGDESKLATGLSDYTDQVVKEGSYAKVIDLTIDRPKSVMSNGLNVMGNEEALVGQELSKKPEEENINGKDFNKKDTDGLDADKELEPDELTSKERTKQAEAVINSTEPGVALTHKRASEETSDQSAKKSRVSGVSGGSAHFFEKDFSKEPSPTFEGAIDSSELSVLKESKESGRVASGHFPLGDKDAVGLPPHQMFLPGCSTPSMDERVRQMGPSGVVDLLDGMANDSAAFFSHAAESIHALECSLSDREVEARTLKCRVARYAVTIDLLQKTCEQHSKKNAELYEPRVIELDSLVAAKNLENSQLKKQLDELVLRDKVSNEKISLLEMEVANLKSLDEQTKLSLGTRAVDTQRRATEAEMKTEAENSE